MSRSRHYSFRPRADVSFLRWKARRDDVRTWNETRIKGRRRSQTARWVTRHARAWAPWVVNAQADGEWATPVYSLRNHIARDRASAIEAIKRCAEYLGALAMGKHKHCEAA